MAYSLLLLPRKLAKTRVLHYIRLFFPTTVGFSRMCVCVCARASIGVCLPYTAFCGLLEPWDVGGSCSAPDTACLACNVRRRCTGLAG